MRATWPLDAERMRIRRHLLHAAVVRCAARAVRVLLRDRLGAPRRARHAAAQPRDRCGAITRRARTGPGAPSRPRRRTALPRVTTRRPAPAPPPRRSQAMRRRRASRRHATRCSSPVPTTASARTPNCAPPAENLERVRAATLCLVNRERPAHGEAALRLNGASQQRRAGPLREHGRRRLLRTRRARRRHAARSRMRAAGYIFSSQIGYDVGENIAWATLGLGDAARRSSRAWMASPGHRANILDATLPRHRRSASRRSPLASLAHGQPGAHLHAGLRASSSRLSRAPPRDVPALG